MPHRSRIDLLVGILWFHQSDQQSRIFDKHHLLEQHSDIPSTLPFLKIKNNFAFTFWIEILDSMNDARLSLKLVMSSSAMMESCGQLDFIPWTMHICEQ